MKSAGIVFVSLFFMLAGVLAQANSQPVQSHPQRFIKVDGQLDYVSDPQGQCGASESGMILFGNVIYHSPGVPVETYVTNGKTQVVRTYMGCPDYVNPNLKVSADIDAVAKNPQARVAQIFKNIIALEKSKKDGGGIIFTLSYPDYEIEAIQTAKSIK